jgi:hypothetical protein
MHIAIIYSSDIRSGIGSSERVYQIAKELSNRDFQVTLGAARFLEKSVKNQNLTVITMSSGRITLFHVLIWLAKIVIRGLICRYDIVQIEASSTKSLALFILLRPFCKKLIIVFHDKEFPENDSPKNLVGRLRLVAQRIAIALFDAAVTPGLSVEKFLKEQHGAAVNEKLFVIPSAVPRFKIRENIDSLEVRRKYGLAQNTFIAVFFGTLTFEPNYEAALYLHKVSYYLYNEFEKTSGVKLIFVVAGLGSEKLPKTEHFVPIGFVEEFDELLTLPDVIVLPHFPSYTGTHIKTLYSFLSGKPVIASEDAVKDVGCFTPKKHFLLFDIAEPSTLLKALLELYFDRPLGRNLAVNAYIESQKFTWAHATSLYVNLYRMLLTSGQ